MRILIAVQYYFPYRSGLTEYARLLAEGLVVRGHTVTVLTSQSSPNLAREENLTGVRVIRLPVLFKLSRGAFMPGFLPALARLRKSHDMVNLHFPMPAFNESVSILRCWFNLNQAVSLESSVRFW